MIHSPRKPMSETMGFWQVFVIDVPFKEIDSLVWHAALTDKTGPFEKPSIQRVNENGQYRSMKMK